MEIILESNAIRPSISPGLPNAGFCCRNIQNISHASNSSVRAFILDKLIIIKTISYTVYLVCFRAYKSRGHVVNNGLHLAAFLTAFT